MFKDGIDQTMVEGASTLPYQIPNLRVSAHLVEVGRADVVVALGRIDAHRLRDRDVPRHARGNVPASIRSKFAASCSSSIRAISACSNKAAEAAGWGKPLPEGRARGIAVHESFKSFVAHVVEVSVGEDGLPKVERVVAAADCGIAINPNIIEAQIEGGMGYGLSAAMYGAVDLEDGRVAQSNFNDYRVLRINEMPDVEVHIVESSEKPDRHRRARRTDDRASGGKCMGEADGRTPLLAAVFALSRQGVRS